MESLNITEPTAEAIVVQKSSTALPSVSRPNLDEYIDGWTVSLKNMPRFSEALIDDKLIHNSETMPDGAAPKAFHHKSEGYKLWKEGYVSQVKVKPGVKTRQYILFIVKAKIAASMESIKYDVYIHLKQDSGKVVHAKCSWKAGQGGSCKHVASLLYTLLDYSNLDLKCVPEDVTCTQVL